MDRKRKQAQKDKEKAEDERLERKFYENMRIEAQKKSVSPDKPSYFMMRTQYKAPNQKEPQVNNYLNPETSSLYMPDPIQKRGGYHNQSVLDNFSTAPN